MMSESCGITPSCGHNMKYACRVFIAVGRYILVITISLVTQPFWPYTMEDMLRGARWLGKELKRRGYPSESHNGWWIWNSFWMSTLVGPWNSPPVSSTTWNVPQYHWVRAERDRMHVPLRLLGQCTWTWPWGWPIHHGTSRLSDVPERDEGHIP